MGATKHHKLTSFLAQSNTVSCLSIGPKSSRVLVTGGLDRIVNLWAIGNHSPVLSLQGHVTSIHSVAMDWPEELVVAGSSGGCLKLWDLQEAKVIRTLAGHRASIGAVEFHPFGEFFASGSADQSVKIWDVRRKGCIQTYHGHSDAINSLEITPDGRWIASASDDGTVKIWDMTAGKLLHTLDDAAGPILSVTFNPSEFVIATTSQDGSIRVYDLQSFDCISTYNDTYSKFILFSPNGQQLLTCCQDALQVLSWDPISLITEINVNWSNVKDLKVLPDNDKAIACTTNGNYVDVWAFQLPLSQGEGSDSVAENIVDQSVDSNYQLFTADSIINNSQSNELFPKGSNDNGNKETGKDFMKNTLASDTISKSDLQGPSQNRPLDKNLDSSSSDHTEISNRIKNDSDFKINRPNVLITDQMKNLDISSIEDTRDNDSNKRHAVSTVNDPQYQQPQKGFHYIPRCDGNRVLNLDLSNFIKQMPGRIQPSMMMSPTDTAMPNSDVEVLDALTFRHTSLINIFQTKLNNIRSVKEVWDEDNIRPSIEVLASLRDSSVLADILKIIVCKPKLLSLDMAQLLLPLVSELLFEIFEDYIVIACQTITLLCKSFSNLILSTLSIAENRNSVDLNLQERVNKCTLCRDEFVNSKSILVEMNTKGSLSLIVQETISELAVFQ